MNKNIISITLGIITTLIVGFSLEASAGTEKLPKGITKFRDGEVVCYMKGKAISCVVLSEDKPVNTNTKLPASGNNYGA